VIERAAGALRHLGAVEFGQDLVDAGGGRTNRIGDVLIAQRAIALAVLREIERDDRNVFALGVGPDVGFGPMQDRMNAQMRAGRRRSVELVPELRGLIAHVPAAFESARREHALLGAGRFLIAANAGDQAVKAIFGQRPLQPFGLARGGARGRRQGRIDRVDRRAGFDLEIKIPFLAVAIAERVHLRKFLAGVDMQCRKRHAAEEGLARQPDHHVGIFSQRPQQRELLQPRKRLPQNVDALRLELVEMVHRGGRQLSVSQNFRHG
jgi:hypothetical protein